MPLHIKFSGHLRMTVIADDNSYNNAHKKNIQMSSVKHKLNGEVEKNKITYLNQ